MFSIILKKKQRMTIMGGKNTFSLQSHNVNIVVANKSSFNFEIDRTYFNTHLVIHWAPMKRHLFLSKHTSFFPFLPCSVLTLSQTAKDDTCLLSGSHHVNLSPTHCLISRGPPSSAAPRYGVGFPRLTFRQCDRTDLEREGE